MIYLEYKIMNLFCLDFFVSISENICLQEKLIITNYIIIIIITNLFSPSDYKKNAKQCISILKIYKAEEVSLEFRLRKIDELKTYLLDQTKHNDSMSEKYKKA